MSVAFRRPRNEQGASDASEAVAGSPGRSTPPPDEAAITASAVDHAFERIMNNVAQGAGDGGQGISTPEDDAAVRAVFGDLAAVHVAPLRNLMLEVRWGQAQTSWISLAAPALRSLVRMSGELGFTELVDELHAFSAALGRAAQERSSIITEQTRRELLDAYTPLVIRLGRVFALEGEHDRREPLIVQSLVYQVPGVHPLLFHRICSVGLNRLETLLRATEQDIAAVAGVPRDVAAAIGARIAEYRQATPPGVAGADSSARRGLDDLLAALEAQHRSFEAAAAGWTAEQIVAKKRARRERELAFWRIKLALARLGEVDFMMWLEQLPFARRIEELARFVRPRPFGGSSQRWPTDGFGQ